MFSFLETLHLDTWQQSHVWEMIKKGNMVNYSILARARLCRNWHVVSVHLAHLCWGKKTASQIYWISFNSSIHPSSTLLPTLLPINLFIRKIFFSETPFVPNTVLSTEGMNWIVCVSWECAGSWRTWSLNRLYRCYYCCDRTPLERIQELTAGTLTLLGLWLRIIEGETNNIKEWAKQSKSKSTVIGTAGICVQGRGDSPTLLRRDRTL